MLGRLEILGKSSVWHVQNIYMWHRERSPEAGGKSAVFENSGAGLLRPFRQRGRRQTACKPGSVPRRNRGDGHSSGTAVAGCLSRPTRTAARKPAWTRPGQTGARPRRSYSVLLPVRLAVPRLLPAARCALTAPFHPSPPPRGGGWFRWGAVFLPAALSGGPPPPGVTRHRVSVEPGLSSPCRVSPLAGRGHPAVWPCQHRYPAGSGQGVRPTL